MSPSPELVAVDLGKSRCRVAIGDRLDLREGHGSPGLAEPGGVTAAHQAISSLLKDVDPPMNAVGVGAAGAWTAPDAASELARRLADAIGTPVAVASDVVTAHAGAFAGAEGVLLIAGTGAAALGIETEGARLIDGWGPDVGDFGSGSWLGREALRAVLRADAGLGPDTVLREAIADPVGAPADIVAWVAQREPLPRHLATLAPLVLDAAASGDPAASDIAARAVRLLTATAVAASSRTMEVALHGGLVAHDWFRGRLTSSLDAAGRRVAPSAGDALDGAFLIARRFDLPHERFVHRAE